MDINVKVPIGEEDSNWGWPEKEGPLGGVESIKIDIFDGSTEKFFTGGGTRIIPGWSSQHDMSLVFDNETTLDDASLYPTYMCPRIVETKIYHATDSRVNPDLIEEQYSSDNPDRWTRRPIFIYDEDDRENYEAQGWDDDPIEEGSRRWKISTKKGFHFRVTLKKSEDIIANDSCPDMDLDGDQKKMKIKEGEVGAEAEGLPIRYATGNSAIGQKLFIKFEEIGTNSYCNYLNNDGTENKVSWLHPYGIYYCWFDTSDLENFKITAEPRYDADEIEHGNIMTGGEGQVYAMPRRWYFTMRSSLRVTGNYGSKDIVFTLNDDNDPQEKRDFIDNFYRLFLYDDGMGGGGIGAGEDDFCNYLIDGDPWNEYVPGHTPSDEDYTMTLTVYTYNKVKNKVFGWWGRFPDQIPWDLEDDDEDWGDRWNDEHGYPSTLTPSKMEIPGDDRGEFEPEFSWSWCPTYHEIRNRYLDLAEYEDQEDIVNGMIVTGGTASDFHIIRAEWPINVYDAEFSQTFDTPLCPGNPTSQHDHWVQVDQARTSWNLTGPFMRALYFHNPNYTACTLRELRYKDKLYTFFKYSFFSSEFYGNTSSSFYEDYDWATWYWEAGGEFDNTEIPFGIGISPSMEGELVGIVRQKSKAYFIWRRTDEEMSELSTGTGDLDYLSFEGHRLDGNINGMYVPQRNYGDDTGLETDALGEYWYDDKVDYSQHDDIESIDQYSGEGGRKLTKIGRIPTIEGTSASSSEINAHPDVPETNPYKNVDLGGYFKATTTGAVTLAAPVFVMMSAIAFSLRADIHSSYDNGWGDIIKPYEDRVHEYSEL